MVHLPSPHSSPGPESVSISTSVPKKPLSASSSSAPRSEQTKLESQLLQLSIHDKNKIALQHQHVTAPLMTNGAFIQSKLSEKGIQHGFLGEAECIYEGDHSWRPSDDHLYLNTSSPLSALVCGVQGSGKSHTVACMLESMFIQSDNRIGMLSKPLCGLILHVSEGGLTSSPNEVAWVGLPLNSSIKAPQVKVFVSPSQLKTMKSVYSQVNSRIQVHALYFAEEELDAQAFLSMMAVGGPEQTPLYIQIVLSILRELGEDYTFRAFQQQLDNKRKDFNPAQEAGIKQRLALLESFLPPSSGNSKKQKRKNQFLGPRFAPGQITIIDLSDPFIDPSSASGLFEVITRLFVRAKVDTGKVIVVDEAHKYLSLKNSSAGLTNTLLTLIREQRHKGMRVIISTQEPTVVPPVLLELCTVAIMHRFSSPSWWEHVKKHVSADLSADAFDKIVKLNTGESLVFAPSGLYISPETDTVESFGRRYIVMRTRNRITGDGGSSILVK